MTRRVKPANSDNAPIKANSGNELAVSGRACAKNIAGVVSAWATSATGRGSTIAVTGTSSPVGWTAAISTILKVSTGTAVVSTGIARTGSLTIFASSIALFFG